MCEPVTFYARVTMRQMLEHLQGLCVGNHAIAQYIRVSEEAQQQSARVSMTITDATLVMISTKAMLENQCFPTTNKKWETLGRSAQTWGKWKERYNKS